MKQIIICAIMIAIASQALCQQTNPAQPSIQKDFLKKSKNLKGAALALLGGGSALIIGGLLIGNRKESTYNEVYAGVFMIGLGIVSASGSIPLFIGSARNKRRAKAATAYLKFEKNPFSQQTALRFNSYPAVCLKINL